MKVLLIGSGPIIVGQACEFDYAGTQACKALKEDGHQIILLNSNPASIMTDPENSDKTYIEEMNDEVLKKIIELEKPDALLPTLGGQVALNLAMNAWESGVLQANNVKLIGVSYSAIQRAEDRTVFKDLIRSIGLDSPKTFEIRSLTQINDACNEIEFPIIIRTSYTLGGSGCYTTYNKPELTAICKDLFNKEYKSILLEEYLEGWKEYELEVVRDKNNNCIVVCSIENIDPMGVHTGDSITVAPAQTLSDKEYQKMRADSFKILDAVGVETGGANVQFAVNPKNGRMVVIEMNPRVSRSSALASKVTGYPIARIATKLALGYTLDELHNKLLGKSMPASFEPTIDYIVTKIPKFNFNKFPELSGTLGIKMQSVGEVIGIGRNFQESLMKAIYSLEIDNFDICKTFSQKDMETKIAINSYERIFYVFNALYNNFKVEQVHAKSKIDPWFLEQISYISTFIKDKDFGLNRKHIKYAKRLGLSDKQIAQTICISEKEVRDYRMLNNITPKYKKIDTCAAEFKSEINYMYSTYEDECEAVPTQKQKVIIVGSGANRIGQGIEFDYSCVHAVTAAKELGYETIIINSNPETISTDFDISDRLYLEPVTAEYVLNIVELEKPLGTFFQFGGQTSINLLKDLPLDKVKILGTNYEAVDLCENRVRFKSFLETLNVKKINSLTIHREDRVIGMLDGINFPIVIRPSYIISGSSMRVIKSSTALINYLEEIKENEELYPILVEEYLDGFKELEIDGICDGIDIFIPGIMEQIEPVGIHSGDSRCIFPSFSIEKHLVQNIIEISKMIVVKLNILGLFNIQFAVKNDEVYVIEVNPRASRTIPYLSKSLGIPLAKIATKAILGVPLSKQGVFNLAPTSHYFMKVPVFSDALMKDKICLGPEMLSTGEKMHISKSLDNLYKKSKNLLVYPISLQEIEPL